MNQTAPYTKEEELTDRIFIRVQSQLDAISISIRNAVNKGTCRKEIVKYLKDMVRDNETVVADTIGIYLTEKIKNF